MSQAEKETYRQERISPYNQFTDSLAEFMYYAEGNVARWNSSHLEAAINRISEVEGLGLALNMEPRVLYPILRYGTRKIVESAGEDADGGQRRILENRLARYDTFLNIFPVESKTPSNPSIPTPSIG